MQKFCIALGCLAFGVCGRNLHVMSDRTRSQAFAVGSSHALKSLATALFVLKPSQPMNYLRGNPLSLDARRGVRVSLPQGVGSSTSPLQMSEVDSDKVVEDLLRLCAITDRGQRATEADRARILELIQQSEANAPESDANDLNGNWRLACSLGESVYRSSPFFWAFRQATAGLTTPVGIPGASIEPGDRLASAVYGITDAIPFYDIGPAKQIFSGVCSEDLGCPLPEGEDEDLSDGSREQFEPSDGTGMPFPASDGEFESQIEIRVGRLFGLPSTPWTTQMTTTGVVQSLPNQDGCVEVDLGIERTEARQSTIAQFLPQLEPLLGAPSGVALEAVRKGSSYVRLRSKFPTRDLRISRPVLTNAPTEDVSPVFVYVREK